MYAIVSLLDEQHNNQMLELWQGLEAECGLAGVALTPLPHFSWHIAAEYDLKRLETALAVLAAGSQPFTVRTTGLGFFTGASPVVFIPVVKDRTISRYHQQVWDLVLPAAMGPSDHYAPEVWVPHITLAYGDVDAARLGCAMEKLAFQPFSWEIPVDHLALVYQLSGQVGRLQSSFPFGSTNDAA
ncbi:MAG TPA: 2'-5' RNA ligase family protein [Anaerolineales bacterium]